MCFRCFLTLSMLLVGISASLAEPKQILLIAGKPSHGYGAHEHYAGLKVLEESILASTTDAAVTVVRGWPEEDRLVEEADAIVIYCDGGQRHLAISQLDRLTERMNSGCGLVCLHYAVETVPGDVGDRFIGLLGGHFEVNYSVNPHWVGEFESFPEHPVTRGVQPFATNDEWYFHLRFRDGGQVTPILAAVAPPETMRRADGPHSGNPAVRKSVAAGDMQTVAWTYDRPEGGRAFGFTGGHYHWNWAHDDVRRLVTNAILWTAGSDIAKSGASAGETPTVDSLQQNQDYAPPKNFDPEKVKRDFKLQAADRPGVDRPGVARPIKPVAQVRSELASPRQLFASETVTKRTPGHRVDVEASIQGVRDLFLVVSDAGDGFNCDWADWISPTISGPAGTRSLLDLSWQSAQTGFGKVVKNGNCAGKKCVVDGTAVSEPAIGTHASSVIHFRLPEGFERFTATGALDAGGTDQNGGKSTSVQFHVYADAAPAMVDRSIQLTSNDRGPESAVKGLEVADGLQVTLSASEPVLRSLTNLDIDDRGRVWVCDVMNYRRNQGTRPEGDRILILEDTTGDGVMDSVKTFYQGRDIDSAMGLCVLPGEKGNEVIVTASPNVWRFVDEDGDDIPDRKEAMFTETGQPQHDHSAHSFLFGPDGKLYWNVGNTGQQVKDAEGNTVVDIHGRPVVDDGKPFYGGMPFRCDLDGSDFEVLAHNFRNNWETTVDSFGTLWQSDNDDDGNKGTRINFVMEHGNYGYRDELTGAGWRDDRITMEDEIPRRHWHLDDPGVVPNLLQTGAGSPSGICMYEGRLLPERFWDQVIHCDPGPNVVRAYPAQVDGAGYSASIEPMVTGTIDKWFRPADVCVAPDGSLFVTDWYDPGVGGHHQGDTDRGRLFRVAPPGVGYKVPEFDFSTPRGAAAALGNPNLAVRYKAWRALASMGDSATPALNELLADSNPRMVARAIWLLGKMAGQGEQVVASALSHSDPDIRITGIRLGKQLGLTPSVAFASVVDDPSPAVRREVAISLRFDRSPEMPGVWAALAKQHDGRDRWYLESLGIASDLRADECFAAWRSSVGDQWDSPAGRDIVWRTRAAEAAVDLVSIIADAETSLDDTKRLFRALEYHDAAVRTEAMGQLLALEPATDKNDRIMIRAMQRMSGLDIAKDPRAVAVIDRQLDRNRGTAGELELIRRYQPSDSSGRLMSLLLGDGDDSTKVEAFGLLGELSDGPTAIRKILFGDDSASAAPLARIIGLSGNGRAVRMLSDLIKGGADVPFETRKEAVVGLARNKRGQESLLELASSGDFPADVRLLAGGLLTRSQDDAIEAKAAELFPSMSQKDQKPLAPLDQLASMKGDVTNGKLIFQKAGTCANCHIVDKFGKEVGPDLSEIGSKLSREAMLTAILDPSAGISHNYETYMALTDSGQVINGLLISETDEAITLRTVDAIDRKISQDEIEQFKKAEKSIMPENLHHLMDQQGLVDVVEYMVSLKKTEP